MHIGCISTLGLRAISVDKMRSIYNILKWCRTPQLFRKVNNLPQRLTFTSKGKHTWCQIEVNSYRGLCKSTGKYRLCNTVHHSLAATFFKVTTCSTSKQVGNGCLNVKYCLNCDHNLCYAVFF